MRIVLDVDEMEAGKNGIVGEKADDLNRWLDATFDQYQNDTMDLLVLLEEVDSML